MEVMTFEMMQRIRSLMEQRDVNQDALARIAGVSKGSVSHWFAGRVSPKAEPLARIADYFGVTVEYLLTGESVGVRPAPVRMVPILGTTFAGTPDDPIESDGEAMLYDSIAANHPRCYALRVITTSDAAHLGVWLARRRAGVRRADWNRLGGWSSPVCGTMWNAPPLWAGR